jgi:hypothetical protein
VSMSPGKTEQARMPWMRSSALIDWVKPAIRHFEIT